jgi:hypothetical protein
MTLSGALRVCGQRVENAQAQSSKEENLCSRVVIDFIGARIPSGQFHELLSANPDLGWNALAVFTDHPSRESFW